MKSDSRRFAKQHSRLGKDWLPLSEILAKDGQQIRSGFLNYRCETACADVTLVVRDNTLWVGVRGYDDELPAAVRLQKNGQYKAIETLWAVDELPVGIERSSSITWFSGSLPADGDLWLEVETCRKAISPDVIQGSKPNRGGRGAA